MRKMKTSSNSESELLLKYPTISTVTHITSEHPEWSHLIELILSPKSNKNSNNNNQAEIHNFKPNFANAIPFYSPLWIRNPSRITPPKRES